MASETVVRWGQEMRRLAPGFYLDATNAMHLDLDEIVVAEGLTVTDRNREFVAGRLRQITERHGIPFVGVP